VICLKCGDKGHWNCNKYPTEDHLYECEDLPELLHKAQQSNAE
jgi:hypothetical protein